MLEVIEETLIDSIKILPFLFITYLLMEYIEHKTSEKANKVIKGSGKIGPLIGSILGAVPQCGISSAAANLYSGRIITLGTLYAVFLSTSDEMLPVLISENAPIQLIFKILGLKVLIGIIFGFMVDFTLRLFKKKNKKEKKSEESADEVIGHMCEHDHCDCEHGIVKSTIKHTLSTFFFILIITFIINVVIFLIGEENVKNFIANIPVIGLLVSGLFGLIPNCAGSVIITELFLANMLSFGSMMGGLLVGSGVGILMLYKNNKHLKENIYITIALYLIGILSGFILDLIF